MILLRKVYVYVSIFSPSKEQNDSPSLIFMTLAQLLQYLICDKEKLLPWNLLYRKNHLKILTLSASQRTKDYNVGVSISSISFPVFSKHWGNSFGINQQRHVKCLQYFFMPDNTPTLRAESSEMFASFMEPEFSRFLSTDREAKHWYNLRQTKKMK